MSGNATLEVCAESEEVRPTEDIVGCRPGIRLFLVVTKNWRIFVQQVVDAEGQLPVVVERERAGTIEVVRSVCLLYTSDAADE